MKYTKILLGFNLAVSAIANRLFSNDGTRHLFDRNIENESVNRLLPRTDRSNQPQTRREAANQRRMQRDSSGPSPQPGSQSPGRITMPHLVFGSGSQDQVQNQGAVHHTLQGHSPPRRSNRVDLLGSIPTHQKSTRSRHQPIADAHADATIIGGPGFARSWHPTVPEEAREPDKHEQSSMSYHPRMASASAVQWSGAHSVAHASGAAAGASVSTGSDGVANLRAWGPDQEPRVQRVLPYSTGMVTMQTTVPGQHVEASVEMSGDGQAIARGKNTP